MTAPTAAKYLTITDAARALRSGEVTATDLLGRAIAAADASDELLGVYLTRFVENSRAQAVRVDEKIAAGMPLAPLDGIPLGIKDIMACSQGPTTAQSLVLDPEWAASVGNCTVVQRLESAGAIVTGKTTTLEFSLGTPDTDKPFPIPLNPWNTDRWAGGSSSGSGSGVAAGMFLGAIGSDTGGSIRVPAAFNGITGMMPTFGRVPKSGVVPLAFTLDHVGPMARSAADCALILSIIAGCDPTDPYSSTAPVPDYIGALTGDLSGVNIGVDDLDRYAAGGIDAKQPELFAAAVGVLKDAGATIVPVELPMYSELTALTMMLVLAEAHAYHRPTLRKRWNDYNRATRMVLAAGAAVTGADYVQAQRVRRAARQRVAGIFADVDLIVSPTAHMGAPRMDSIDELSGLNPLSASVHTFYWNPLGNATLAVPIGLSGDGMPLSMSISGRPFADADVLRAGDAYQRRTAYHLMTPTL